MSEHHDHADHGAHETDTGVEIDESFKPVRGLAIASVEVDGETVCYDAITHQVHVLNETATVVWQCLLVPGSIAELIDDIVAELDVERAVVREHVLEVVGNMVRNGLVVPAGGDVYSPPPPAVDGGTRQIPELPTSCMQKVDALGWAGSINVRLGDLVLGIRANSDSVLTLLGELLSDYVVDEAAPPNYSVRIVPHDAGAPTTELRTYYRSCELTSRSRFAHRVVEGLLAHLSAQRAIQESGAPLYAALGLVSGSRIVLADRRLRAVLGKLEPRLHARGIAVSDAPVFGINDADVTVARPSLTLSPTASATLVGWDAGVRAGREPQAVQPGRYDLVGLLFDTELDEHEEPVPMSPRELLLSMLAQVPNLARVDGQETLNVLGRARDRAPQRFASWIFPERVAEAAAALLAIDS